MAWLPLWPHPPVWPGRFEMLKCTPAMYCWGWGSCAALVHLSLPPAPIASWRREWVYLWITAWWQKPRVTVVRASLNKSPAGSFILKSPTVSLAVSCSLHSFVLFHSFWMSGNFSGLSPSDIAWYIVVHSFVWNRLIASSTEWMHYFPLPDVRNVYDWVLTLPGKKKKRIKQMLLNWPSCVDLITVG